MPRLYHAEIYYLFIGPSSQPIEEEHQGRNASYPFLHLIHQTGQFRIYFTEVILCFLFLFSNRHTASEIPVGLDFRLWLFRSIGWIVAAVWVWFLERQRRVAGEVERRPRPHARGTCDDQRDAERPRDHAGRS